MNYRIRRDGDPNNSNNRNNSSDPVEQPDWAERTLRDVLLESLRENRRARLWRNIWRGVSLLVFLSIVAGIMNRSRAPERTDLPQLTTNYSRPHTAVIDLTGVIGGNEYTDHVQILREGMKRAYGNKNVRAIIIRANSPGGSPVISNIAFTEVKRMKAEHKNIPVYVVTEDMCASGCYYIAAAADKIYADPSSLIGSIGVIGSSFDLTGLIDKIGVKRRVRIAGDNKDMGDPFTPETPEQQAIWQQMLDQVHAEFIKSVREGRGSRLQEQTYPDLYSGRIFTGVEAKKAGLIDDFGSIYSVSRDVVKAPELIDYTPRSDDFLSLFNRRMRSELENGLNGLFKQGW